MQSRGRAVVSFPLDRICRTATAANETRIFLNFGTFGLTWIPFDSLPFTWTHSGSFGPSWIPLDSLALTWAHLESLGFIWTHLDPLGFPWIHLDSIGFSWAHLDSLGFSWVSDFLVSLGYIYIYIERER